MKKHIALALCAWISLLAAATAWGDGNLSGSGDSLTQTGETSNVLDAVGVPAPVKKYKVAFKANGGKGTMSVEPMTYGSSKKLTANAFYRKGYVFAGWAKSKALADSGHVTYKNGQKVKSLVATGEIVRLYAVWKEYEPKTPGRMRFALCQIPSGKFPASQRIDKTFAWAKKRLTGAEDAIVFPEFTFATFKEEATAWKKEKAAWKKAAAFAKKYRAYVFVNHPSRTEGKKSRIYSETRVFAPDGTVAAVYRKRVLASMDRAAGYSSGPKAVMAHLPFANVGILICKDAFRPKKGFKPYAKADVLLVQFAHPGIVNRKAKEAETFETPAGERKHLRDSRKGWKKLGKPYMAVNKVGTDGIYTLAGGTFAAKASGKVVTGLEMKADVLFVDYALNASRCIEPTPFPVNCVTQLVEVSSVPAQTAEAE